MLTLFIGLICPTFFRSDSEWKDGLLPVALRKHLRILQDPKVKSQRKPLIKWLHLDGTVVVKYTLFVSINNSTNIIIML